MKEQKGARRARKVAKRKKRRETGGRIRGLKRKEEGKSKRPVLGIGVAVQEMALMQTVFEDFKETLGMAFRYR